MKLKLWHHPTQRFLFFLLGFSYFFFFYVIIGSILSHNALLEWLGWGLTLIWFEWSWFDGDVHVWKIREWGAGVWSLEDWHCCMHVNNHIGLPIGFALSPIVATIYEILELMLRLLTHSFVHIHIHLSAAVSAALLLCCSSNPVAFKIQLQIPQIQQFSAEKVWREVLP